MYVHYIIDFGVEEIKPIEFDSNPERVTAAFYCINRDFILGRIIDVALVKDFLGIKPNDVDHKYFWIDEMFFDSGMQPWIDFNVHYENGTSPECDEDLTTQIISVEVAPIDDRTLRSIEDGSYWDPVR